MKTDPKRMTPEQWAAHWKKVQEAAQHDTHIRIGGKEYERLPYGARGEARFAECPDCAVAIGQLHVRNCDTEICPACGALALGCDCGDSGDRQVH